MGEVAPTAYVGPFGNQGEDPGKDGAAVTTSEDTDSFLSVAWCQHDVFDYAQVFLR